jgi:glycosyltransferase involved in cell wall biosynthesis
MTRVSIVVPIYFNELNLPDTIPRLLALRDSLDGDELELVFVDDGSGDNSLKLLLEHRDAHPDNIKIVKLTRNFGSLSAIQAGLTAASGDCVGISAADLQDPPELLVEMVGHWRKGVKVVLAVREAREDPLRSKMFSAAYYSLIRRYALPNYPQGGFDCLLVDRQVVDTVNKINEKNTNLMSLIFWLGYRPVLIPYVRRKREKGRSRWTLEKKIKLFIDSFVGFSYAPIRGLSLLGLLIATSAFVYAGAVIYAWAISGIPVKGYAPTVILIAFTSGIQMTMLGVVGEYLWRTLDEVRNRPAYVIDEVYPGKREQK